MNLGEKICQDAWAAFDRWCSQHDPDGTRYVDAIERAEAYSKWCDDQRRIADLVSRPDRGSQP